MKKHIKKHGFFLFLILTTPYFLSCSLIELNNDANVENISCEKKKYKALVANSNHKLEGKAQVYQGVMQGKKTVTCDVLDMNSFTAAHATLPLPSYIKITNKTSKKSVVVKVNDRSPLQQGSVLQVTPAIASLLEAKASFPVKIEIIPTNIQSVEKRTNNKNNVSLSTKAPVKDSRHIKYYIVVGTYVSQAEAFTKFTRLSSIGIINSTMETRNQKGRSLHMVRIGPFYQQDEIDKVKNQLQNDGLVNFTVVRN